MKKHNKIKSAAWILLAALLIGCENPAETGGLTQFIPSGGTNPPATSAIPSGPASSPESSGDPSATTASDGTPETTVTPGGTAATDTAGTESSDQAGSSGPVLSGEESSAEILAVGDNLFHMQLVNEGNKLGYDRLYAGIKDVISAADLAIINQETALTTGTPSGYPKFATPTAVCDAAIRAGFDVFTCATNHTWDLGEQGIIDTLAYFSKHPEVKEVGLNNDKNERSKLDIVEVNGISIAIFNFGTLINTKSTAWWRANYLDKSEGTRNWIAGQIAKAKKQADFVMVCVHWGDEYVYTPVEQETYWAQFFADCEVDLVIGGHPHVVQPVQQVTGKNGNQTLVYYSLGNFLHAQTDMNTNVGGMAKIRLHKDKTGKVRIENYELIATTVDCQVEDGVQCYTARLLSDMTDDLLKSSWKWGGKGVTVADFEAIFKEAIASFPNQSPAAA